MQTLATSHVRLLDIYRIHVQEPRKVSICTCPPEAMVGAGRLQTHRSYIHTMQDLAAQRLEALGPTTVSYTNESGSEARRAQAEREFLRMEREGPPTGTK